MCTCYSLAEMMIGNSLSARKLKMVEEVSNKILDLLTLENDFTVKEMDLVLRKSTTLMKIKHKAHVQKTFNAKRNTFLIELFTEMKKRRKDQDSLDKHVQLHMFRDIYDKMEAEFKWYEIDMLPDEIHLDLCHFCYNTRITKIYVSTMTGFKVCDKCINRNYYIIPDRLVDLYQTWLELPHAMEKKYFDRWKTFTLDAKKNRKYLFDPVLDVLKLRIRDVNVGVRSGLT